MEVCTQLYCERLNLLVLVSMVPDRRELLYVVLLVPVTSVVGTWIEARICAYRPPLPSHLFVLVLWRLRPVNH